MHENYTKNENGIPEQKKVTKMATPMELESLILRTLHPDTVGDVTPILMELVQRPDSVIKLLHVAENPTNPSVLKGSWIYILKCLIHVWNDFDEQTRKGVGEKVLHVIRSGRGIGESLETLAFLVEHSADKFSVLFAFLQLEDVDMSSKLLILSRVLLLWGKDVQQTYYSAFMGIGWFGMASNDISLVVAGFHVVLIMCLAVDNGDKLMECYPKILTILTGSMLDDHLFTDVWKYIVCSLPFVLKVPAVLSDLYSIAKVMLVDPEHDVERHQIVLSFVQLLVKCGALSMEQKAELIRIVHKMYCDLADDGCVVFEGTYEGIFGDMKDLETTPDLANLLLSLFEESVNSVRVEMQAVGLIMLSWAVQRCLPSWLYSKGILGPALCRAFSSHHLLLVKTGECVLREVMRRMSVCDEAIMRDVAMAMLECCCVVKEESVVDSAFESLCVLCCGMEMKSPDLLPALWAHREELIRDRPGHFVHLLEVSMEYGAEIDDARSQEIAAFLEPVLGVLMKEVTTNGLSYSVARDIKIVAWCLFRTNVRLACEASISTLISLLLELHKGWVREVAEGTTQQYGILLVKTAIGMILLLQEQSCDVMRPLHGILVDVVGRMPDAEACVLGQYLSKYWPDVAIPVDVICHRLVAKLGECDTYWIEVGLEQVSYLYHRLRPEDLKGLFDTFMSIGTRIDENMVDNFASLWTGAALIFDYIHDEAVITSMIESVVGFGNWMIGNMDFDRLLAVNELFQKITEIPSMAVEGWLKMVVQAYMHMPEDLRFDCIGTFGVAAETGCMSVEAGMAMLELVHEEMKIGKCTEGFEHNTVYFLNRFLSSHPIIVPRLRDLNIVDKLCEWGNRASQLVLVSDNIASFMLCWVTKAPCPSNERLLPFCFAHFLPDDKTETKPMIENLISLNGQIDAMSQASMQQYVITISKILACSPKELEQNELSDDYVGMVSEIVKTRVLADPSLREAIIAVHNGRSERQGRVQHWCASILN